MTCNFMSFGIVSVRSDRWNGAILTLKTPSKIAADDSFMFLHLSFEEKMLYVSCESSARQRIHMKCLIFSEKKKQ